MPHLTAHQVLHNGWEREHVAAGRDLRRHGRPQRDGTGHLPGGLHVHLLQQKLNVKQNFNQGGCLRCA